MRRPAERPHVVRRRSSRMSRHDGRRRHGTGRGGWRPFVSDGRWPERRQPAVGRSQVRLASHHFGTGSVEARSVSQRTTSTTAVTVDFDHDAGSACANGDHHLVARRRPANGQYRARPCRGGSGRSLPRARPHNRRRTTDQRPGREFEDGDGGRPGRRQRRTVVPRDSRHASAAARMSFKRLLRPNRGSRHSRRRRAVHSGQRAMNTARRRRDEQTHGGLADIRT